ncbi:uncharacterized protein LOC116208046 isoform X1 [Punica granatum]|uniref:Uncharacterized protein LOC116208046 isoform X1 n=4 Tax=Punica granatum TaxID=22663 RepID=A0A6P8DRX1_PUNGR|nr:uncharacterized protein LOC116208046 isoform X1 [Punica granatum]
MASPMQLSAASLQAYSRLPPLPPGRRRLRSLRLLWRLPGSFSIKVNLLTVGRISRLRDARSSLRCLSMANTEIEAVESREQVERPPFDINLAVILAGFSFEAYTTPPENIGRHEGDAAGCKTVYLSESFVREIYDGQLLIKLKKGIDLPAMDPWGTSDPYVVMQMDGQIVKSKVKWGTKEPTWNENFTFNIKLPPTKTLQVAAWDANLVTPHKRMGNVGIGLELLCDGNLHELVVELEGMGGGGKLQLEVRYKSFDEIEDEKKWWRLPFVSEFFRQNGFGAALKSIVGSETVPARQFVEYAFGQLKSFNGTYLQKEKSASSDKYVIEDKSIDSIVASEINSDINVSLSRSFNDQITNEEKNKGEASLNKNGLENGHGPRAEIQVGETTQSDKKFWKDLSNVINQRIVHKLGLPAPEKVKWDGIDLLNKIGLQSRNIAEASYVESGLASPEGQETDSNKESGSLSISAIQSSIPEIKKVTQDLLRQTDSVLGALMVLTATVSELNKDGKLLGKDESRKQDGISTYLKSEELVSLEDTLSLDEKKAEEMRALFSTAESAMEAWAMLATSLGHPSFIKSEFEKICFLDNASTDTQVAIWRDIARRRLVVAFRGTEQSRWKDLRTDLMLAPAGLNPERIGGDFKQEVQVHSGFLSAYDSVRIRIISLLKLAIGFRDDAGESQSKWHVYVTGHSLGGALATLLALELSSSQLAKRGVISVTMYNFGSPRVGNKRFAELYNEKVKDSWRVVNHRDIIPTVPRLMGYCHVAQPVYLAAGDLNDALINIELLGDGYQGDLVGEATPDVLVSEFMKGEKELIEKILQTEINIFRSIRDGSALMQHMEDFYYINLLEKVRSNYRTSQLGTSQVRERSA